MCAVKLLVYGYICLVCLSLVREVRFSYYLECLLFQTSLGPAFPYLPCVSVPSILSLSWWQSKTPHSGGDHPGMWSLTLFLVWFHLIMWWLWCDFMVGDYALCPLDFSLSPMSFASFSSLSTLVPGALSTSCNVKLTYITAHLTSLTSLSGVSVWALGKLLSMKAILVRPQTLFKRRFPSVQNNN